MEPTTSAAYVRLEGHDGEVLYSGESIYRPGKPHPRSGEPRPTVGIPDDAMRVRPSADATEAVWLDDERILVEAVYLDRVATCWWFILSRPPRNRADA
jgi:hypothetical protein